MTHSAVGTVSGSGSVAATTWTGGDFYNACVTLGADHYYAGNESGGSTVYDRVGAANGTLTGDTPTFQEEQTALTEPAVLDWPSDDGMSIPAAADPVNGTTPFSVCAWVKLTSSGNYQNIYQRRGPSNQHGFILYAHPTWTELIAIIGDGTNTIASFTGAHTYGTIYMVTAVYDGTKLTIYLNGTKKDSWTLGFTPVAGTDTPSVSSITGNSLPLAIFKGVALSDSDVSALYSAGAKTTHKPTGTLTGSGTLSAAATVTSGAVTHNAIGTVTGAGSLSGSAATTHKIAGTFSGSGSVSASTTRIAVGAATVIGAGALAATGSRTATFTGTLPGLGSLTANSARVVSPVGSVDGAAALTAAFLTVPTWLQSDGTEWLEAAGISWNQTTEDEWAAGSENDWSQSFSNTWEQV